jgi:hypothetical protein
LRRRRWRIGDHADCASGGYRDGNGREWLRDADAITVADADHLRERDSR